MENGTVLTRERIGLGLQGFPSLVTGEFEKAWDVMSSVLSDRQLDQWAQAGLELAQQSARSWEAAGRYFKVSPKVVGLMRFNSFLKWSERGSVLCQESPVLAVSYFEASPGTVVQLRSSHIEQWADLGRSLYKGTWKSGTLSCKLFEHSPALLQSLTVPELAQFVALLDTLARRSYDLSVECLVLGQDVFPLLGSKNDVFMSLVSSLAETSWRQVKGLFEVAVKALPGIEAGQRLRFLNLAERLRAGGCANVPAAMLEVSESLGRLDRGDHGRVLELAESLVDVSPPAVTEFIKSCPLALERVTPSQLESWFDEGVRVLRQNSDGGLTYFRRESARSLEVLETLSSGVEFTQVKGLMELYCLALAGQDVQLAPSEELVEKNIGWVSNEAPSTEGSTVFVPTLVARYPTKAENFTWLKVISTHQVAHLEFGSFHFEFEKPSTLFRDMRPRLSGKGLPSGEKASTDAHGTGAERGWLTDMQRFFDLMDDRRLALDIFTVVEDGRLDARVKAEYLGMKGDYLRVQADSLGERSRIESLPTREAMAEFLVRLSLDQHRRLRAPAEYAVEARKVARIARRVLGRRATVEDSAEATLRIYAILSQIPNEEVEEEGWQLIDLDEDVEDEGQEGADEDELLLQLLQGMGSDPAFDGEQDYRPSEEVDYRGDFKPELVQLLFQLRSRREEQQSLEETQALTQEMLEELLRSSAELELEVVSGDVDKSSSDFASNMLKEVGWDQSKSPELGHFEEEGGALEATEPQSFVYDEWDFRADDYKPRWCIVRQKGMAEGDPSYYNSTLHNYMPLVNQVRRQFELMVPEDFKKVRKLEDGEEIHIDDAIEALIDIRSGASPSDKLYWRRNKVRRDVAVVFLLDTSASTAEAIEEARKTPDEWDAPDDPVEYMVWLRTRRGESMRRSYKRIIDLEKEAIVLLVHALEAIGDVYGIYGFSGYGRENVEFYTVKDINEGFSEKVKRRIDRIAPLHATRMGPAIRHATSRLETQEARTKLLFLISDGRPQDRGYSREGVEKEYAVHDTKMALNEAMDKEINTFCLTVDKNGHDYLRTMCQDIGYEVLDDIYELPRRLLYLYRRLTT